MRPATPHLIRKKGARPPRAPWPPPSPATLGGSRLDSPTDDLECPDATRRGRRAAASEADALPKRNFLYAAKRAANERSPAIVWLRQDLRLAAAGVELGRNYPRPVVSLRISREVALEAYRRKR